VAEAKLLKAFEVSEDFEGHSQIVWATCGAAARREAMAELNAEFNQLSTKRRPELDKFDGDLDEWKFHQGWWSTCNYQPCHKERCSEDDGAVYRDGIWCCCEEHVALEQERRAKEKAYKAEVTAEALRVKPGSTVHDVHLNPDYATEPKGAVWIWMTFPSGVTRSHTSLEWLNSEEGQRA
jgi:hypothetical protein